MTIRHPFLSLQPDEIQFTTDKIHAKHPGEELLIRVIGIKEPSKSECVSFIQGRGPAPSRRTYVSYQLKGEATVFEDVVELSTGETVQTRNMGTACYPPATNIDVSTISHLLLRFLVIHVEECSKMHHFWLIVGG